MTIEGGVAIVMGVFAIGGQLWRKITSDATSAARHAENQAKLDALVIQTTLTNGRVTRCEGVIEVHGREIERLRDKGDRD